MLPNEKITVRSRLGFIGLGYLGSRIARLRRMKKDALISRLVQLEDANGRQKTIETNLRDEILRLLTRAKVGGA